MSIEALPKNQKRTKIDIVQREISDMHGKIQKDIKCIITSHLKKMNVKTKPKLKKKKEKKIDSQGLRDLKKLRSIV